MRRSLRWPIGLVVVSLLAGAVGAVPVGAAQVGDPVDALVSPPAGGSWVKLDGKATVAWDAARLPADFGKIVRAEVDVLAAPLPAGGCEATTLVYARTVTLKKKDLKYRKIGIKLGSPLTCYRFAVRLFRADGGHLAATSGLVISGGKSGRRSATASGPTVEWLDPSSGSSVRRSDWRVAFRVTAAAPLFAGDAPAPIAAATITSYAGKMAYQGTCAPLGERTYWREKRRPIERGALALDTPISVSAKLPFDDICRFLRITVRDAHNRIAVADTVPYYVAGAKGPDSVTTSIPTPTFTSGPLPSDWHQPKLYWAEVPGAAKYECTLRVLESFGGFRTCTSPMIYGLRPGDYTFYVRAVDAAGGHTAAALWVFRILAPPK